MLRKKVNRLVNEYGPWRLAQVALAGGIIILAGALSLELMRALRSKSAAFDSSSAVNTVAAEDLSQILPPEASRLSEVTGVMRPGLFKLETSTRDRPMADKTIERIRSQLKLQCIMELNGKSVAYVNIEGVGLQRCEVGDSVNDLFTVLNINKKSIEITIVGHREILGL